MGSPVGPFQFRMLLNYFSWYPMKKNSKYLRDLSSLTGWFGHRGLPSRIIWCEILLSGYVFSNFTINGFYWVIRKKVKNIPDSSPSSIFTMLTLCCNCWVIGNEFGNHLTKCTVSFLAVRYVWNMFTPRQARLFYYLNGITCHKTRNLQLFRNAPLPSVSRILTFTQLGLLRVVRANLRPSCCLWCKSMRETLI